MQWPVWNHAIAAALAVWDEHDGRDHDAFDALARGALERSWLVAPVNDQALAAQLAVELEVAHRHLVAVTGEFWEPEWRRAHRGGGHYPEEHLWCAAHGFLDLQGAPAAITT